MDPLDPSSFNLQEIKLVTGRKYQYCDQTPSDYRHGETPVLLCLHGFPELWYDWRYQIGPWVRRGWRIIIPSMLGYAGTDKPDDLTAYTPLVLAGEMAGLLDALDIKQPVVVVAHDWGSAVAWSFATRYTERTRAVISMSIPHQPPLPMALTVPQIVEFSGPDLLGYWLFLCSDGGAAKIQSNIPLFIDCLYRSHKTRRRDLLKEGVLEKIMNGESEAPAPSDLLSEKERSYQIETIKAGGIASMLNYYKQIPHAFAIQEELGLNPVLPSTLPILLIAPDHEPFCSDERIEPTRQFVPSMEVVHIDSNHYVLLEKRDEVTQIIGDWLEKKLK